MRSRPEEEDAQEGRLEEEGEDALGGERRAEDVAHEGRVARPVRAELELHDDAGGHAHGEGQREDAWSRSVPAGPTALGCVRQRIVSAIAMNSPRPIVIGREDEMERHREGELQSRESTASTGTISDAG